MTWLLTWLRPTWPRRVLGGLLALVIGLLAVAAGGWLWLRQALPRYAGSASVPGLSAPVSVARDGDAIPHIFAANAEDAGFALGYVHAQDRLWQMDMMRRLGAGRLSELFGVTTDGRVLRTDTTMRTLGLYRLAEESYAALAPEVRRTLDAYAAGVNAFLASRRGPLPLEFQILRYRPEPWTPADSLVWGKLMALQLSGNYRADLTRARLADRLSPGQLGDLYPAYPAAAPISLAADLGGLNFDTAWRTLAPPLGPGTASNEWVLAGNRTGTGKPILANDPHLGLQAPILWYLARIETPELRLAGATVPGVPFVILGHNDAAAWGFTTTGSDVQDLFVERLDANDPGRYLTPAGSEPFRTRIEVIKVRGAPDVTLTVRVTRHGPVISDIEEKAARATPQGGHVLALAFTALDSGDTTAEGLWRLNRATTWDDFLAATRYVHAPQQNIVYADTTGTIGFLSPALVPVRKAGDGRLPVPGWTGRYDWSGFIPFDALPRAVNPPSGRIVNANNAVVGPDYPYFLTADWDDHYRAQRIEELLADAAPQTVDTAGAMQLDTVSLPARDLLPLMLTITPAGGSAAVVALLKAWDGTMRRDRPEPLVFEAWLRALGRGLVADELGPLFADNPSSRPQVVRHILADAPGWCDDIATPARESCDDILKKSLDSALKALEEKHGTPVAAWHWGDEHKATLQHQLLGRVPWLRDLSDLSIATDGGNQTVNRGASSAGDSTGPFAQPFAHSHGAGFRAIYDLNDLDNSRFIIATGQSGTPLSPHWGDLVKRWRDGGHVILAGSPADVAARGLGTFILTPARQP